MLGSFLQFILCFVKISNFAALENSESWLEDTEDFRRIDSR